MCALVLLINLYFAVFLCRTAEIHYLCAQISFHSSIIMNYDLFHEYYESFNNPECMSSDNTTTVAACNGLLGYDLSRAPREAWLALQRVNIKMLIDCSSVHESVMLQQRCRKYGIGYFHYPVRISRKNTPVMLERLPQLQQLVSAGSFYMQGVEDGMIALCVAETYTDTPDIPYDLRLIFAKNCRMIDNVKIVFEALVNLDERMHQDDPSRPALFYEELREKMSSWHSWDALQTMKRIETYVSPSKLIAYLRSPYNTLPANARKALRRGCKVYDISLIAFGSIGHLYALLPFGRYWEYDITYSYRLESGVVKSFEEAKLAIAEYMSHKLWYQSFHDDPEAHQRRVQALMQELKFTEHQPEP